MRASSDDLRIAADKAEAYYSRISDIQTALYRAVQSQLTHWPDETMRAFLAAFTRFDAEFSLVQDTLSELHASLGPAEPSPGLLEPVSFPQDRRAG